MGMIGDAFKAIIGEKIVAGGLALAAPTYFGYDAYVENLEVKKQELTVKAQELKVEELRLLKERLEGAKKEASSLLIRWGTADKVEYTSTPKLKAKIVASISFLEKYQDLFPQNFAQIKDEVKKKSLLNVDANGIGDGRQQIFESALIIREVIASL